MKIERKISFTVAGIEFQNLKIAQFFARYIDNSRKACDDQNKPELNARVILNEWYRLMSADVINTDEELIEVVMGLQMPKPARKPTPKKKKVTTLAGVLDLKKKNVQVLAGVIRRPKNSGVEHHTKNQFLEPTLDEQEEILSAGLTD